MLQAPRDAFQRNIGALRNFLGCQGPAMLHNEGVDNLMDASHVVATISGSRIRDCEELAR